MSRAIPRILAAALLLTATAPALADIGPLATPYACLPVPLPAAPTGTAVTFSAREPSGVRFDAVVWRQPCANDPRRSTVMMRATPTAGSSRMICTTSWDAHQSGQRFSSAFWVTYVDRLGLLQPECIGYSAPTTFVLDQSGLYANFDDQKAFALTNAWFTLTPAQVRIPAYTPAVPERTLTVAIEGTGGGRVSSAPSGLACSSGTCRAAFLEGMALTLTARAAGPSVFAGWNGACRGSGRDETARIALSGDTTCTARFMPPPVDPETGWWWSPKEPGRGYSIETRNGRLFMATYGYRPDGTSVWYASQGHWDGFGLTATLAEFGNGQALGGSWRQPAERGNAGTVSLAFSTPTRGRLTYGNGGAVEIERFAFASEPQPDASNRPIAATTQRNDEAIRMQALRDLTHAHGLRRVIVRLEGGAIAAADGQSLQASLAQSGSRIASTFRSLPLLGADVTPAGLDALLADPRVVAIHEDALLRTSLAASVRQAKAPAIWGQGFTGRGQTVAILDTGIESTHPFLADKVIGEACFSFSSAMFGYTSACPGGQEAVIAPGAGAPCSNDAAGCYHGTHVAGIVAGRGSGIAGIAPDASLMSIQVFKHVATASCGTGQSCIGAAASDIIRGLEHVRDNARRLNIVAANLSLGGGSFSGYCDNEPYKPVIDQLRAIGVATVIAAGNDGETGAVTTPACISTAIRVGAGTGLDALASFSNEWALPMVVAPGHPVVSSVTGGTFRSHSGTSMAAPHVAGAWAVLRGAMPQASVFSILSALGAGPPATSAASRRSYPRLDVAAAYERLIEIETGWWWNPAEPGTGYFVEIRNATMLVSAYMYGEDGRAAWYIASGPYRKGVFEGALREYGGGQALGDAWKGARVVADRGKVTLRWAGSATAMLVLPDGREVTLTRFAL